MYWKQLLGLQSSRIGESDGDVRAAGGPHYFALNTLRRLSSEASPSWTRSPEECMHGHIAIVRTTSPAWTGHPLSRSADTQTFSGNL
jgi:hypothetical protein